MMWTVKACCPWPGVDILISVLVFLVGALGLHIYLLLISNAGFSVVLDASILYWFCWTHRRPCSLLSLMAAAVSILLLSILVRVYPLFLRVGYVGHLPTKQVPGLTNAGNFGLFIFMFKKRF